MRARAVLDHFRSVGHWVNWEKTVDRFVYGDPEAEVRGIATTWIPTNEVISEAAKRGLNLLVSHEPAFYFGYAGTRSGDGLVRKKKELLDSLGVTVLRCHDTWDRMPGVGIVDAWGDWLDFPMEERPVESYYRTCLLGDTTVEEVAQRIAHRTAPLGQPTVLILVDRRKRAHRMAIGTGAITHLPSMYELGADLILATDDGMNYWDGGLWAVDLQVPLLIVNHATSEKPGMMAMAGYLGDIFPQTPVQYLDVEFPYDVL
jgi:putative NIF3 family GTP cyclohydrolase 1 type 2